MTHVIRGILSHQPLADDFVGGDSLMEAYVRTMCLDAFAENYHPQLDHLPRLEPSIQVVRGLTSPGLVVPVTQMGRQEAASRFLSNVHVTLGGTCLFILDEGHIGLAPMQAHAGDIVCVVLGSAFPMILRHVSEDEFLLVGTCYTCGVSERNAILGPLPEDIRITRTLRGSSSSQRWYRTFFNESTGESLRDRP